MLIHRDGWQYSGKTPAFFSGQSGCYCCGVGIGSLVSFYGFKTPGPIRIKDTDSYVIDTWTSKTDGPTPERDRAAAATVQGIAYVFGGIEGTSPFFLTSNQSYVLSTDTFTSRAAMTASRNAQAGLGIGDYAYSMGGQDGTFVPLRTTYQYDPAGNSWSTKTDTPTPPRNYAAAFALSGNGYLVGGLSDAGNTLKDNDQYDPSANAWTGKTDCGTQRFGAGGMAIDGKGYFMLGNEGFGSLSGICEEYDASANSWTTKANLSTSSPSSLNRYHIGGVSPGSTSEGFAVSGFDSTLTAVNNHDQYAPGSGVWTVRTVIPSPARYFHACAESV